MRHLFPIRVGFAEQNLTAVTGPNPFNIANAGAIFDSSPSLATSIVNISVERPV